MGPVQVLVVGFERPAFSGEVLAELARLREARIVRLVDLLLVSRAEDGTLETQGGPDGVGAGLGGLAAALLGRPEGDTGGDGKPTDTDVSGWSLTDAIPVGYTAAVALIEHTWAGPLTVAIRRAGGTPLEETWLAPDDLEVLDALMAEEAGHVDRQGPAQDSGTG
jgi:hypothetical protein